MGKIIKIFQKLVMNKMTPTPDHPGRPSQESKVYEN